MKLHELIAAVPVREFRGRPFYVRIADIPPPWDKQFSKALTLCQCPYFEAEGPCAYSHDWEEWVHGRWWGDGNQPTGLHPSDEDVAYVCQAVELVFGPQPPGLLALAAGALQSGGKLTPQTLANAKASADTDTDTNASEVSGSAPWPNAAVIDLIQRTAVAKLKPKATRAHPGRFLL